MTNELVRFQKQGSANRSYWEVEPIESAKCELVKFPFRKKKTIKLNHLRLQVVKQHVGKLSKKLACKEFYEQDASADWKLMR